LANLHFYKELALNYFVDTVSHF